MLRLFALAAFLHVGACVATTLSAPVAALADAERQFAAAGARDGIQKAFLAHFADDAIVLRPFVTSAQAWHRTHPDKPGHLAWGPQYLAVSSSGDLGVSSGPWHFEGVRDGKHVSADGHFLSIWRHDEAHGWRVILDHGIGHGPPATAVDKTQLVALATGLAASTDTGKADRERSLAAADAGLRARLASGAADAYAQVSRPNTLWLREGSLPQTSLAPPASEAAACGCGPRVRLVLAESGDFGYTVGGSDSARDKGIDIRVWKVDTTGNQWTLLVDLSAAVQ
jgi:ketosteroid isomerase-like protein